MLRVVLVILLLGIWFPCFSEESRDDLREWQSESLEYFIYGSAHLLEHEPWRALENFQTATDHLDRSSSAMSFLVSFGQVIAYDVLGFKEQCKQAIGSLFLAVNEGDKEDQEAEMNTNREFSISGEYEEAVGFFRDLAAVAPSPDVRELLFSFIDEIAEEALPAFKIAKAPLFGKADWDFDYGKDDGSMMQCKSWWKKFKKWCYEVIEVLGIASDAYKKINDIRKSHEEGKQIHNHRR
jgi:hypothetical protein